MNTEGDRSENEMIADNDAKYFKFYWDGCLNRIHMDICYLLDLTENAYNLTPEEREKVHAILVHHIGKILSGPCDATLHLSLELLPPYAIKRLRSSMHDDASDNEAKPK